MKDIKVFLYMKKIDFIFQHLVNVKGRKGDFRILLNSYIIKDNRSAIEIVDFHPHCAHK